MSAQLDLFRRVRKPCTSPYRCRKRVQTLAYVKKPMCRGCRRRQRNLTKQGYRVRLANEERLPYWRAYDRARGR